MKYLCLIYFDEVKMDGMTQAESDATMGDCTAYADEIRTTGHYLAAEALQPIESATTVRVRGGRVTTTDGPFAETKEQLGGFYLIDARDLDEAISVATKIPPARLGCVEIRPIRNLAKPWPRARIP